MKHAIFSNWLEAFDADMRRQSRYVCLFLWDSCNANHTETLS